MKRKKTDSTVDGHAAITQKREGNRTLPTKKKGDQEDQRLISPSLSKSGETRRYKDEKTQRSMSTASDTKVQVGGRKKYAYTGKETSSTREN